VILNAPPCCKTLTHVMAILFTFNLQTKFDMSSFIRSKAMAWFPGCKNRSCPKHAHGIVRHHRANSSRGHTKFEVSSFRLSSDISGDVKFENVSLSRDPDHASFRLGLATINLQTKFEVSDYTFITKI